MAHEEIIRVGETSYAAILTKSRQRFYKLDDKDHMEAVSEGEVTIKSSHRIDGGPSIHE